MDNCRMDEGLSNGTMSMSMRGFDNPDHMSVLITFPTDFVSTDATGVTGKIDAGGSMKIEEKAPYSVITLNLQASAGSEKYGGKNLVYKIKENSGTMEMFPVSGEEDFGTGVYFKVDPHYDASKTPMVTDFSDNLSSGLFKYLDGANHKVEAEVTATNEVTVRVDENGNGTFEADEIKTVNVK